MLPERPAHADAVKIVEAAAHGSIDAIVCPLSLKDAYYVCCKVSPEKAVREVLAALLAAFEVADVTRATCEEALSGDEADFEDGLVRAAAVSSLADVIVTRDAAAFATAPFERLAPADLVARL